MPVPFTCPHCGHETDAADEFAGHSGPCAQCGKVVRTWGDEEATAAGESSGCSIPFILSIVVGLFVLGAIYLAAFLWANTGHREAARRAQCKYNMKHIGLGMFDHYDATGRFLTPDGSPQPGGQKVSWRVALLPYTDYSTMHDSYSFQEPWDSAENSAWAESRPNIYRCPSVDNASETETNCVALVGPKTAMPRGQPIGFDDITDGAAHTILAVGIRDSGIQWSEPRDLDATAMSYQINDPAGGGLQATHARGMTTVFCDGSVQFLSPETDPAVLRALTTRASDEPIPPDMFGR